SSPYPPWHALEGRGRTSRRTSWALRTGLTCLLERVPVAWKRRRVGKAMRADQAAPWWARPQERAMLFHPAAHAPFPSRIARQMTSAVAGISICRTPNSDSASTSALATAGMAPTVPASPAPLTPRGLVFVGTGLLLIAIAHMSLARGMA